MILIWFAVVMLLICNLHCILTQQGIITLTHNIMVMLWTSNCYSASAKLSCVHITGNCPPNIVRRRM